MVWNVGNGKDISFWYDNCIENRCLHDLLNLGDAGNLNPCTKVCEFIQNKQWNVRKLSQHISNHSIVLKIIRIPIPITEIKDSYCWGLNSTGTFTTRSATWLAHDQQFFQKQPWQFKWIWKIDTMPKIKIFLWQMCHNALSVRGMSLRWGCHIDPQCPLCLEDIESTDHLFGGCTNTYAVWELAIHHQWIPPQVRINHT